MYGILPIEKGDPSEDLLLLRHQAKGARPAAVGLSSRPKAIAATVTAMAIIPVPAIGSGVNSVKTCSTTGGSGSARAELKWETITGFRAFRYVLQQKLFLCLSFK